MNPGELSGIHSMDFELYRLAAGVSKSMLDKLAHPYTPAHLRAYLDEPQPEPTEAQRFGTILHRALLEPDTMKDAFAVRPDGMDLRTKTGKDWKAEQGDRPILSSDQSKAIERSVASVWKHPKAKQLLKGAQFERCLFAKDSHGTLRKGRLDVVPSGGNVLPDVKTCASAAPEDFEKSISEYRYFVQAAFYIDLCKLLGMELERFVFICVEKAAPFCVALHSLDPQVIDIGRKLYQRDLTVYRRCVETGEWPGYPEDIGQVSLPTWAMKQLENIV